MFIIRYLIVEDPLLNWVKNEKGEGQKFKYFKIIINIVYYI